MTLHALAAAAPLLLSAGTCLLSIDMSCPHGAQQQTRRTPLLLSIDGTDRRTEGRTPDRYYAGRVNDVLVLFMCSLYFAKNIKRSSYESAYGM